MDIEEIKSIQRELKDATLYTGEIDGEFGPLSRRAAQRFLLNLCPNNPWPKSDQASLRAFYGSPGDESQLEVITFPYPIFYGGKLVKTTRVHKKLEKSLLRVLENIKQFLGNPDIKDEAEDYVGVYNFRMKRAGSTYSLHAYGAAIDMDADDNTFQDHWPLVADMNWEIIKAFAREGWTSAAVWWSYDAMHFQATRP